MTENAFSRVPRGHLLEMLRAALSRVAGDAAVRRWLDDHPLSGDWAVLALGKASGPMLAGAREVLGPGIVDALVVTAPGYAEEVPAGVTLLKGAHPVPDAHSLAAGEALVAFLRRQPASRHLLFLISGGASSMVEVLREGVNADDLARVNQWLLGSGLAIDGMNAVRKSLSRIKGGGLLAHIGDRPVTALLISDVPGDDPAVIGSGLLVPDRNVGSVVSRLDLPPWLRKLVGNPPACPAHGPEPVLVATNRDARLAAAEAARALGYRVFVHDELLGGDAAAAGRDLAGFLLGASPGIHVWGGETTVRLPAHPGRGGRNQHLALAAAGVMGGRADVLLLSAGTDGRDGPGEDAGGLVDGDTAARGRLAGFDLADSLAAAASGEFLEASGDLVHTGATGTNVMDLVIGWKGPPA
jgi:hydroxypyruvate reductase